MEQVNKISPERLDEMASGTPINVGGDVVKFMRIVNKDSEGVEQKYWFEPEQVECKKQDGTLIYRNKSVIFSRGTENLTAKFCSYCGAARHPADMQISRIRRNREWVNLPFCRGESCAGYYQMGCEG